MPPKYVKTIRDEIFYEYSKMISRSAFGELKHGFIGNLVKEFRLGDKTMSRTIREFEKEATLPKECVYCGSVDDLHIDHLVPRSLGGSDGAEPPSRVLLQFPSIGVLWFLRLRRSSGLNTFHRRRFWRWSVRNGLRPSGPLQPSSRRLFPT